MLFGRTDTCRSERKFFLVPVFRKVHPEKEPLPFPERFVVPFDDPVARLPPFSMNLEELLPAPAVESEMGLVAQEFEDIAGGVGPDPLDRSEPVVELGYRKARRTPGFKIEFPRRRAPRSLQEVGGAIPHADLRSQVLLRAAGESLRPRKCEPPLPVRRPEFPAEVADHDLGQRPAAVRRADHLDQILKDSRGPEQSTGAGPGDPPVFLVMRRDPVKVGVILIDAQTAFDLGEEFPRRAGGKTSHRGKIEGEASRSVPDFDVEHAAAGEFERPFERARFFIGVERGKGAPTVAADGGPEVKIRTDVY